MVAELMLLNPSPRRKARRKASPAQLRALAAGRRKRAGLATNPAPRKRRKTRTMRAASAAPARRRKARRNPVGGMPGGSLMGALMGAAYGAGGALAIDAVVTYLPLPAMLTTGNMKYATKAGLAVALGVFGRKFLGRAAADMAKGALTVQAYELGRSLASGAGMNLAYMSPAQTMLPRQNPGMAEYLNAPGMGAQMGEYVSSGSYSY